jgi:hypothetical protein
MTTATYTTAHVYPAGRRVDVYADDARVPATVGRVGRRGSPDGESYMRLLGSQG